jgi:chaperonin GroEL (HSP60 family)
MDKMLVEVAKAEECSDGTTTAAILTGKHLTERIKVLHKSEKRHQLPSEPIERKKM